MPAMGLSSRSFLAVLALLAASLLPAGEGRIERAADAPQPHRPEESLRLFRVAGGFRIELAAAEPLLADPTGIAFDEHGRLFVCELHGYNLDGHYDVEALNATGRLDRQVRRIPASREAIERAEKGTYGTVRRLDDLDGDGRMDRATLFADRLPPTYGIIPARGGLIAVAAPEIIFLADRDGDGRAEVRETLFRGFGVGELWTRISNPRWGPDGWIYVAMGGGSSGTIRGPRLARPVRLGETDFRFRADGTALEPVTGGTGGFGQALTDYGERFLLDNSHHARYAIPLPYADLARNPFAAAPRAVENAAGYTDVYPISAPHPWRLARSRLPDWVRFYGAHEARAQGNMTAMCGPLIYRDEVFPPEYRGNHFSCESQQNLVHRSIVERDGPGFRVRRAPGEERREFLASSEGWFRPVDLALGPDGAIWIVDMYREIIEDYSAIPRFLQQQYGLIEGADRGRLWRVVAEGAPPPASADLARLGSARLVEELESASAWRRGTAQRLLLERGARQLAPALRALLGGGRRPTARLAALWTLENLHLLEPGDLLVALADAEPGVRVHALRLAEGRLDRAPRILGRVVSLASDADARVRLAAALALGASRREEAFRARLALALEHGAERWIDAALLSAAPEEAARLLDALLGRRPKLGEARGLLEPLARVVGARREVREVSALLDRLASAPPAGATESSRADSTAREAILRGLLHGLQHGEPLELRGDAAAGRALARFLAWPEPRSRELAFRLLPRLGLEGSPALAAALRGAAEAALERARDPASRAAAARLLSAAPFETVEPVAQALLDPREPIELQLAAIDAVSASTDARAGRLLLSSWERLSPRGREAVLSAVFARQERLAALLAAIEAEEVPPSAIRGVRRIELLEGARGEQRERMARLFASGDQRRSAEARLAPYLEAVRGGTGDRARGESLFREHCSRCHRVGQEGNEVGPDLSAARTRADETLLDDILLPSDRITAGYTSYVIVTGGGDLLSGRLAGEGATSVTLVRDDATVTTVLRRDIETMEPSEASLMPEGMEEVLSPSDVAAIIAWLRGVFGRAPRGSVVLFDDDPRFPQLLVEGGGTATIDAGEPFSGKVSLAVTPLQRYSARIPGWRYRIAERPDDSSYRYLRLAWRARGADGVMIELAAGGRWPPPDSPERRYFAGRNGTAWKAKRVAEAPPAGWKVITLDLWRDGGEFTLTGIAPTAIGGRCQFDRIELLRSIPD